MNEPADVIAWFMVKAVSRKVEKAELTPWGMVTLEPLGTWYPRTRPPYLWPLTSIAFSSTNAMLTLPAKELHRVNGGFPRSSAVSITKGRGNCKETGQTLLNRADRAGNVFGQLSHRA